MLLTFCWRHTHSTFQEQRPDASFVFEAVNDPAIVNWFSRLNLVWLLIRSSLNLTLENWSSKLENFVYLIRIGFFLRLQFSPLDSVLLRRSSKAGPKLPAGLTEQRRLKKVKNLFGHDQTHPKACPKCKKLFASVLWLIRQKWKLNSEEPFFGWVHGSIFLKLTQNVSYD